MNPNPYLAFSAPTFLLGLILFLVVMNAQALPTDRSQPMKISSESASFDQKQGIVIYNGAVKLSQGTLEISADKITVRTNDKQKVETIIAEGSPAHYQQQPEINKAVINAEATNIIYVVTKDHLTLDKNAYVEQNGATTRGGKIDYDITSGTVNASGAGNESGRVEFVIPPQIDKKE